MLSKERMREYQRVRRLRLKKESKGVEHIPRANTPTKLDCVGISGTSVTGKTASPEPILPVPVLAEPQQQPSNTGVFGEARESTRLPLRKDSVYQADNSSGGQKPFMNETLLQQEITHTITDIKFEGLKPGYYIFEKEIVKQKDGKDRKCWYCGCAYESRLLLNKFCCPDHKERWLIDSFRRGKE